MAKEEKAEDEQLEDGCAARVDDDILPPRRTGGIETLMKLIQAACESCTGNACQGPTQLPVIGKASCDDGLAVAPGSAQRSKKQPTQDGITSKVASLPDDVVNGFESLWIWCAEEGCPDVAQPCSGVRARSEVGGLKHQDPAPDQHRPPCSSRSCSQMHLYSAR